MSFLVCTEMAAGDMKEKTGMGVAVSTLHASDDPPISDEQKSAFDWCKEGNSEVVRRLLQKNECDVEELDENVIGCIDVNCKSAVF